MTVRYVKPYKIGAQTGTGVETAPWNGFQNVPKLAPGIVLSGGCRYFPGTASFAQGGAEGRPIVYQDMYLAGDPGSDYALWLSASYVELRNIYCGSGARGDTMISGSNILLSALLFLGVPVDRSVYAWISPGSPVDNITIDGCKWTAPGYRSARCIFASIRKGVLVNNWVVRNCVFDNVFTAMDMRKPLDQAEDTKALSGMHFDNNTVLNTHHSAVAWVGGVSGGSVKGNYFTNIGDPTQDDINALELQWLDNVEIANNSIDGVSTSVANDGHGVVLSGGWGISRDLPCDHVDVHHNTIKNAHGSGISLYGATDCTVTDNHCERNNYGVKTQGDYAGNVIERNVLVDNTSRAIWVAELTTKEQTIRYNDLIGGERGIVVQTNEWKNLHLPTEYQNKWEGQSRHSYYDVTNDRDLPVTDPIV